MSSQLATIISTLADVSIMVSGVPDIHAIQLHELPESVDSWRMPQRLILPIGAGRAQGQLQRVATFKRRDSAGVLVVDWTLSDILFYRAADAGVGLADSAPILIAYVAAYLSAVAAIGNERWSVTGMTFPIIGPFEWPVGGRTYDGVQAELTIREII